MHPAAREQYPPLELRYLDTATYGLPPVSTVAAVRRALDGWATGTADWIADWDVAGNRCRELVAPMFGAPPGEIALQPAVSVAAAIALTGLRVGGEIVVPDDEFASILLPALVAAEQRGAAVRRVPFEALVESIDPRTALVVTSHVRSNDGRVQDLAALGAAAAEVGARVLLDATHSAGVLPVEAERYGIDYVVAAAYKHLLCPRGVAFLRVATGAIAATAPITASWRSVREPYDNYYSPQLTHLAPDAARYDVSLGWHAWVGAAQSLGYLAAVPARDRRSWCVGLAAELADELGVPATGSSVLAVATDDAHRAEALRGAGIVASGRDGRVRLAFHLYNDHDDVAAAADLLRPHLVGRERS